MTWNEYLPLAEKTLSTQFHCEEREQRLLHAVMGALTEVEELLENYKDGVLVIDVNKQGSVGEESADIFWYYSILFREYNLGFQIHPIKSDKNPYELLISFTKENLKMLDFFKKKIFYNKEINETQMIDSSITALNILIEYCTIYNVNIEEALDKNIAKLKARYGDKFTSDKAINRDLEKEKNILEK